MNIKTSSLVALLAFAAAPLSSHATDSASNAAFDACIKAFTNTLPKYAVRDTKIDTSYSSATAAYWKPSSYTVELRARGAQSGSLLAQASCVVNKLGIVLVQDETARGYEVEVAPQ